MSRILWKPSDAPPPGEVRVICTTPYSVCALACGDAEDQNPKVAPNEDALMLQVREHGEIYAAVADSHFGALAAEVCIVQFRDAIAAPPLRRSSPKWQLRRQLDAAIENAQLELERTKEKSASTFAALHLHEHRLSYASVGDSYVYRIRPRVGIQLLNELRPLYVSRPDTKVEVSFGDTAVTTGDVILLATDGLDEKASGLNLRELCLIMGQPLGLEVRMNELVQRACFASAGGGGDNLAIIALEITD